MRAEDRQNAERIKSQLRSYSKSVEPLPGIESSAALNTFVFQITEVSGNLMIYARYEISGNEDQNRLSPQNQKRFGQHNRPAPEKCTRCHDTDFQARRV